MPRFFQRKFTCPVVFSIAMLVFAPAGFGSLVSHNGCTVNSGTGPTLPPYPWDGLAAIPAFAGTGPTLPPYPWDGLAAIPAFAGTGPTLPPYPWDGLAATPAFAGTGPTLPPIPGMESSNTR
jgi:hypothetical protein